MTASGINIAGFIRKCYKILALKKEVLLGDVWILTRLDRARKEHAGAEGKLSMQALHKECECFYSAKQYSAFQRRLSKLKELKLVSIQPGGGREKTVTLLTEGSRLLGKMEVVLTESEKA